MNRTKNTLLSLRFFCTALFALVLMALPLSSSAGQDGPPENSFDGLELVRGTEYSYVYRKPGVNFKDYKKIAILSAEVTFKKDWKTKYNRMQKGISHDVSDKDIVRMKKNLSALFDEVFLEELGNVKGFELTSNVGEGVLLIRPMIINLDVNAPDIEKAPRTLTFVEYAGEGTLYLELYDSVSGAILARAVDTKKTRNSNFYQWATRASKRSDTRALLRQWAKILSKKLEEVHASEK